MLISGIMSGDSASNVRAWAVEHGFDVPDRGRLGADIRAEYERAHSPAETTPDVGEEPSAEDADHMGALGAAEGYQRDPEPGALPKRKNAPRLRGKTPKVTAETRRDIEAKTALMLTFPAAMWARRDPYCGTAAIEQVEPVSSALARIFCDSPDLVLFFTSEAAGYMKWLELMTALQPVAETVWNHHVRHTIGQLDGGGPDGGYAPPDMSAYHAPAL